MQFYSVETTIQSSDPHISVEQIRHICWVTLAVVASLIIFSIWFDWDARRYLLEVFRKRRKLGAGTCKWKAAPWTDLEEQAQWVVDEVMAKLPSSVLTEAEKVPVLFDERRKTEDGRILLGMYRGFSEGLVSERKGPIVLYLRNIEESCAERDENFQKEVRTTYLHELGHHFGWSEQEVEERGL